MEEIELNGKKYIEHTEEVKNKLSGKPSFIGSEALLNNSNTFGLMTAKISGNFIRARYSVEYLKTIVTALDTLQFESVEVFAGKDTPMMFGRLQKDGETVIGIALAPRVDND